GRFQLYLADAARMDFFPAGSFDCALAMELICYSIEPERIMENLRRVLKRGGWLFISVENKSGALIGDNNLSAEEIAAAIADDDVRIENYLYVKYYCKKMLREMLEGSGFKVVKIVGCQYTVDGVFDRVARRMMKTKGAERVLYGIERLCRRDAVLKDFPRAWFAVARK
ncbi:MAG: methyltransferase domain-containing protein, partial [bacterium]